MLDMLCFLILFPLIAALLMLILPNGNARDIIVKIAALITAAGSVYLFAETFGKGIRYVSIGNGTVDLIVFVAELVIALFIIAISLKFRKYIVTALGAIQLAFVLYLEYLMHSGVLPAAGELFADEFSMIMTLIIGLIGGIICVYSVGYMRGYHEMHKDVKDHRKLFFFLIFLFLSAMYGVVYSNNLVWLLMFWEITSLCSFLLIGYARDELSWNNAFRALMFNVLGGIAFSAAILYIVAVIGDFGYLFMDKLLASGSAVAIIPAALIGFAGLTKSAQYPFSSWLVGAMVAPTPVSALLHSSTMVKAGVYIIVRFAPIYEMTYTGMALSLVGGITFLIASAVAIGQSNAKKVLAYSTIANLGLVVACAGIGTEAAIWAAILLIIFHAVAKSLLFLSVGSVEHQKHSRDIEDMTGLISEMPKVSVMMLIGIAGMFLAPFGMLISKWAAIVAFIDAMKPFGAVYIMIIAFGSALTVFFWTKWMGKLIEVRHPKTPLAREATPQEMFSLYFLTTLTVLATIFFPLISYDLIIPYLESLGSAVPVLLSSGDIITMFIMTVTIVLLPLSMAYFSNGRTIKGQYMSGRPVDAELNFSGSLGRTMKTDISNYYIEEYFGEEKNCRYGIVISVLILAVLAAILVYTFTSGAVL